MTTQLKTAFPGLEIQQNVDLSAYTNTRVVEMPNGLSGHMMMKNYVMSCCMPMIMKCQ